MKIILASLTLILVFVSCNSERETKMINEDFQAIGFVGKGNEISVGNGLFMHSFKFQLILFVYHDTIFQIEINNDKPTYSYLKCSKETKGTLITALDRYNQTSLKEQLIDIKKNNLLGSCAPDGYFLFKKNAKLNFGLFAYESINDWIRKDKRQIKLTDREFPKIYESIFHTLNSKGWDYFMSDDYHYKKLRFYYKDTVPYVVNPLKNSVR
ncbi:MAG: hypothetical protein QE487_12015 [Fluviicola sp.]|nr:hypothetical protein [Fluviicola sp.]